jgi:predicted transglutaminase-like cysteine proteinase
MFCSQPPRLWRDVFLACGLVLFGVSAASAGILNPTRITAVPASRAEPFQPFTAIVTAGALHDKWAGLERQLDDEALVLVLCQEDRARCASPAARQLLGIVDDAMAQDGRARLGHVNRAINLAVRPGSDMELYGAEDVWRSPLALLETGAGDCEDYAIAKFVALRAAGVAADDLRLVILRDTQRNQDHAVVAARLDGNWLLLDNRRMSMIDDGQARQIRPLFVIDRQGVRQYLDVPQANAELPLKNPADLMKLALRVR